MVEQEPRQRVERTGRRRARLTPVDGTETAPAAVSRRAEKPVEPTGSGPNDARMRAEKPPHY